MIKLNIINKNKIKQVKKFILAASILGISSISSGCTNISNANRESVVLDNKIEDKTIEEILSSNSNLDDSTKNLIINFKNQIENDFDLTIFKANLSNLKIEYLDDESFNVELRKRGLKGSTRGFFDFAECKIYINNKYNVEDVLNHELFHVVNVYYMDNKVVKYSINQRGVALLEGMTATYTDIYFEDDTYAMEKLYVDRLEKIVGSDRIKFYYEKGTVNDTINDLSKLYANQEKAIELIELMDNNYKNKNDMDIECYDENKDDILELLDTYFFESKKVKLKDNLKEYKNNSKEDKKVIFEMYLAQFFKDIEDYNYYGKYDYKYENFYNKESDTLLYFYKLSEKYGNLYSIEEYGDLLRKYQNPNNLESSNNKKEKIKILIS